MSSAPWMGTKWPNLRSLDIYANRLEGAIPESLGQLRNLSQVQLQDNALSGELPAEWLSHPKLRTMVVQRGSTSWPRGS